MYLFLVMVGSMLVLIVYLLFLFMSMKMDSTENSISVYECGFDQSMGSRVVFSYRFFLISILFLVFDVEITLLIPLPYVEESLESLVGLGIFLVALYLGLVYEYYNGVLEWAE